MSDSTLQRDRDIKRPLYAQGGIVEVWIVDVQGRYVEVAYDPFEGIYRNVERFSTMSERPLVPQLLPDMPPLDVAALFQGIVG